MLCLGLFKETEYSVYPNLETKKSALFRPIERLDRVLCLGLFKDLTEYSVYPNLKTRQEIEIKFNIK